MLTGAVIKWIINSGQGINIITSLVSSKIQVETGMPCARKINKLGKRVGKVIPRTMTLNDNSINYVHWDDSNELVDHLRLLETSRQAGHNAHEILSIIEERCEAGFIINRNEIHSHFS